MSGYSNFNQFGSGGGFGNNSNNYSYGGGGGGGGGGQSYSFSNTGSAGGQGGAGWMSTNDGDDNKVRGGYQNHTLRPVTVKQLNDVPSNNADMPVIIDGEEIKQLTFVGVVRNITKQAINVTFTVEDGSGKIDVRMWAGNAGQEGGDGDDMSDGNALDIDPEISVGKYVRVYGDLKFFGGKRHVNAHHIRAVKDSNEVTYHGMEAIYVHLTKTRGPPPARGGNSYANPGVGTSAIPQATPYSGGNVGGGMYGHMGGLSPVQIAVLEAVKSSSPQSPEGVQIHSIQQSLQHQYPNAQVVSAIDWLVSEGHLYNTIDENHVLSTDSS